MRKGILITILLIICGAARAFDAAPLLPFTVAVGDEPQFRITFLTGTFPENIVLGAAYPGPAVAADALYDPGDGVWREFGGKTNALVGSYFAIKGDWRTGSGSSPGSYQNLFDGSFQSAAYTCKFSGALLHPATVNFAYNQVFKNNTAVVSIEDNPFPPITGSPRYMQFRQTFYGMSGVAGALPEGFMDTSALTGSPAAFMFFYTCAYMSNVESVPDGFMSTSGMTGAPAASMFQYSCLNMSKVTSLPAGFCDTSGMTGAPAGSMAQGVCRGMSGVTGPLPAGFANTSGLTGAPAANMFQQMCQDMSGVTGPLPTGFADTSGLTGAPAQGMFQHMCYGMSGVTGPLPPGFADTSGLTGAPAVSMYDAMCRGMAAITSGNIIIGENLTLDATNVAALTRMMQGCSYWTGEVFWGSDLLVDQVTPSTKIQTFYGCANMPGYADIHENWKNP